MLPIYVSYFAGGYGKHEDNTKKVLINAFGFVLGFTIIFVILGAFAGSIGWLLRDYRTVVNIVTGLVVVIIGLSYVGVISFSFVPAIFRPKKHIAVKSMKFHSAILFGAIFSVGWTPCMVAWVQGAADEQTLRNGIEMARE